jgi:hypothetical protein
MHWLHPFQNKKDFLEVIFTHFIPMEVWEISWKMIKGNKFEGAYAELVKELAQSLNMNIEFI